MQKSEYQRAVKLFQDGKYSDAVGLFTTLSNSNYLDSADQAKECKYLLAKENLESGEYEDAYEMMRAL